MSSSYRVEDIEKADVWSNDRGQFQAWTVRLTDSAGAVHDAGVNTKLGNDFASIGETVEGDLIPGARGLRFKKAYGGAGGGGGGNGYKRDPAESRSIVRQHSQDMALRYIQCEQLHDRETPFSLARVKVLTRFFQEDAEGKDPTPYVEGNEPKVAT